MKILYVASDQNLGSYHGGTIHVLAVTRELVARNHEVHVILQQTPREIASLPAGAKLHTIERRQKYMLWRAGDEVQEILDSVKPGVVIERYYNFAGEAILRSPVPTILEVNSPMIEYEGSLKSKVDALIIGKLRERRERIASRATIIMSPMKEIIPEQFHQKVREIEWGADADSFNPEALPRKNELRKQKGFADTDLLFIHFGSLRKWHGIEILTDAFLMARKQLPPGAKCVIIGPSEATKDGIISIGRVPHEEMPIWLKIADAAILPFAVEQHRYLELGFYWSPLKLFEAMSMELPLITRDHPRLKHILGTDNARYYYDGTIENLSQKMVDLTKDLSPVKEFRNRIVRNFSWKVHGEQLNQWIEELS